MKQAYGRWMSNWENRLAFRSTNRVVRPFDWGLEWTRDWPIKKPDVSEDNPEAYLKALNQAIIDDSETFFGYEVPTDFRLHEGVLRFTSAVKTAYPANNIVHGKWFPARTDPKKPVKSPRKAVLVLPHWNASADQHAGLCKGIAALGISCMRLSLPYHDYRMPAELERADYAVSSNIARTMDATRQAVIDIRSCLDWMESQGFERLGIVGTSLGSCYAFLASAHDDRLAVNAFNHCSTYVADVVWTGLSTQHIRQGLEGNIDLDRLREVWSGISPPNFMAKFAPKKKKSLFIYAAYDTTFPTHLSEQVVVAARELNLDHKSVVLPCGHYTLGESPFKFMDGYHICSFLKRNL